MKSLLIPFALVVLFIIAVGIFTQNVEKIKKETLQTSQKIVKIEEKEVKVEIVDTETTRNKGLSGKEKLGENEGMLFVFEAKDITPSFWMKDMKIPIDIIWIDNNKIVQIDENVQPPEPDTPTTNLKMYSPNQPVDYVVEVNAGYVDSNNFKVGNTVDLSSIE